MIILWLSNLSIFRS